MLKLNASYSKKVPADTEYSSQSYHASVEVELPDGLTPEQLNARIHETFAMVRDSVEAELHGEGNNAGQMADVPQLPIQSAPQLPIQSTPQNKPTYGKKPATDSPASPKQIKFLLDLARQNGYTVEQLKARFNVSQLEDLSRTQCSRAIDILNGKAA